MFSIETLPGRPVRWLESEGPRCDVVLSTRVRLARNLPEHTFPERASDAELSEVLDKV
ncbi:MAG: ATP--guanido phosphotransferase, partial [Candidatus Eisenbacteria bacterium]|nr:ATP--guanido phosphotransferase [Candidatus Eisenbacteria bacterium]